MIKKAAVVTYKAAKRIVIFVVGTTVVLTGVVMLVTPGPALVVIPLGLAILSIEFAWARRWLRQIRERISETTAGRSLRRKNASADGEPQTSDEERKRKQGPEE
ncbi:MAG: PGPGW domain-containing protein [Gammaproteobacteria bacterium]|jgi:uncharacterized protein (TIGR02611 family)